MPKRIVETLKLVSRAVHKKKLAKTKTTAEYLYGSVRVDTPLLTPYIGKRVRVEISTVA